MLKALIEEGVDTIFGYPGGAIIPVYDRLYDYKDKLKHILVRHEQGATHAADTALSFKNSSPYQKQHYFIARIRAGFSLVLHFSLLGLTD